ncbi:hypothetical protein KSP40_PGU015263 [Platanthera guangdongensis]|uniref:Uncharacterized protein n=1 Tax=Platanthera guangdongensis TaxID=2320717 RepID=A0ABR2LMC3_9ASPA
MESSLDLLIKAVAFFAVQILVYLILSKSSCIFSTGGKMSRSFSFRPARSLSIRRMLAAFSDEPADGKDSLAAKPVAGDDRSESKDF